MGVDAVEPSRVEARRATVDVDDVEPLDRLLDRDDLLVAMAPAKAHQIIAQRLGQVAHLAIGLDPDRAVALRQLRSIGPMDQRDMGEFRGRPVERAVDLGLAEGVVEMVVAADHMGDAHVVIVDDHRQVVGRRPVGAQQDQIVEFGILDGDLALHQVMDRRRAVLRRAQADHRRDAGGCL